MAKAKKAIATPVTKAMKETATVVYPSLDELHEAPTNVRRDFGDLAEEDLCTDGKCFAEKKNAAWQRRAAAAKAERQAPAPPATHNAPKATVESRFIKADGQTVLAACEINEVIIEAVARGDQETVHAIWAVVALLSKRAK